MQSKHANGHSLSDFPLHDKISLKYAYLGDYLHTHIKWLPPSTADYSGMDPVWEENWVGTKVKQCLRF